MGSSKANRRQFCLGLAASVCIGAAALLGATAGGAKTPLLAPCPIDRVTISGDFGQAAFNVDLADDEDSRAKGLMHVEQLPMSKGMLFVYKQPQQLAFWMRNTLIELDMLFLDGNGVVQHIHHRAQPLDETVISPGSMKLTGVLEINGGLAQRLGLSVGDVLRHPSFESPDAPWACAP